MLFFVADGTFARTPSVRFTGWPGAYRFHTESGNGSTAVRIADRCGIGAGATVAPGVSPNGGYAGASGCRTTPRRAIVGAFGWSGIQTGEPSVTSPTGEVQTEWVAGPAGTWDWHFTGVRETDLIAAYAPIGDWFWLGC